MGDHRIEGYVENHAFCTNKQTYRVYFAMSFDRPFSTFGTWADDQYGGPGKVAAGSRAAEQSGHEEWTGAYAGWSGQTDSLSITAKVGISYVDTEGAEKNLKAEAETKDFDTIRNDAETAWNNELGVIDVSGGTASERTVFYTALYHSLLMPSTFSDVDGRYLGFDGHIHTAAAGRKVYANFSGWDIYRSEVPLLAMIEPKRMQDMAQSVVLMYKQGGWIDRWPQINLYTNDMAGSPLSILLATDWLDGLHGFDIDSAWRKACSKTPRSRRLPASRILARTQWTGSTRFIMCRMTKSTTAPSQEIQEDAIAYASIYRLGIALGAGNRTTQKTLYDRALYYRNVFDPAEDRYFHPQGTQTERGCRTLIPRAMSTDSSRSSGFGIISRSPHQIWRG